MFRSCFRTLAAFLFLICVHTKQRMPTSSMQVSQLPAFNGGSELGSPLKAEKPELRTFFFPYRTEDERWSHAEGQLRTNQTSTILLHQFKPKSSNHKFVQFTFATSKTNRPFGYVKKPFSFHSWYLLLLRCHSPRELT